MKLSGKVAIVTGAARGIGKAIATAFAAEGAAVVLDDILFDQAKQAAEEIKKKGGRAIAVLADVSKRDEVNKLIQQTIGTFKAVHILVNNAAITRHMHILDMSEEDWNAVLDVNLKGVFNCTQAVLPYMMEQRYGKIINISSVAGLSFIDGPTTANYSASKAGVNALTQITAIAGGHHGIIANCIAPGPIVTEMTHTRRTPQQVEEFLAGKKKMMITDRLGTPEEIASLALFLASDDCNYLTGQIISPNGGANYRL